MIINKISDKNNSKIIAEKYLEWVNSGVSTSDILVLTFNSQSRKNILKKIIKNGQNIIIKNPKIYTFNGLIYNSILDNWADLEILISNQNTSILPNLSGLEVSQYLLKQIINKNEVKGYNSKKSLLHQIFRRYSLIVNNNLNTNEIESKSAILKESFSRDANDIIQSFKAKTIELRTFDYIRQAQIFSHIYKKTNYFKHIKYLIIEDGDELTPLCLDFISNLSEQILDKLILLDSHGGTRIGYLCTDYNAVDKLKEIFNDDIPEIKEEKADAKNIIQNIIKDEKNILSTVSVQSLSKRADMIESVIDNVNTLIKNNVSPDEISIITPVQDKMLKFMLSLGIKNIKLRFLSGSEKLVDNPLVKAIITVLKLSENMDINNYDLRVIFSNFLRIPVKNCKEVFIKFQESNILPNIDLGIYAPQYNKFCKLIETLQQSQKNLSEKAYYAYLNIIKAVDKTDLAKFNFFLKEIQDFEKVFKEHNNTTLNEEILTQIENSIISENPYTTQDIEKDEIIVSTPQKIIDNKIKTKYQFWLDISSNEWIKDDIGPLYNAWVFQKDWKKKEYTIEDNIKLSKEKLARTLRKLILNTDKVIAVSSLFDTQGVENIGGIEKYLITKTKLSTKTSNKEFTIIPREDQKPVLEYKSGRMAISAVPGAGKTTILLALILKLMKYDINPENIYVLTYMESAARNFKDRIKNINPDANKLPNISTIHGLALRILKENANYERIGLNPDFEICDDTQRGTIIKSLAKNIKKQDLEDFDRAISVLKLSGVKPSQSDEAKRLISLTKGTYDDMKLSRFLKFFYNYQIKLSANNLIDYDDILISSVRLLEENNDILEYYQEICQYIIEDEAQDSSSVQQRLISLLSKKHNNLIRCGDINQAITTTFTNADVDGFKKFIENSDRVDMNRSQRCTKGVWELANSLVKYGNTSENKPFYEIYMNPVEGKNPIEEKPIHSNIYETVQEEKISIVNEIKTILKIKPDATIGILLRNNYQVNNWADYINNSGLSAITRNECLGQKTIFRVIFSILKFITNPFDNNSLASAYRALAECGIFKLHLDKIIENYETDFISLDNDEIADSDLSRFHWDMNYWLSFPHLTIDELAIMIGLNYFSGKLEKSNMFLISTLCAKLNTTNFEQTVKKLEDLSTRPTLSGFKFFSEDEESDMTNGKVQIMTLHKSKGDEFDYVFLPEMTDKNLTLTPENLKIKKSSLFMENVRGLNHRYKKKDENQLKDFLISENYRLLYVAITRAKLRLYISTHKTETYYGKKKDVEPIIIMSDLLKL